MRHVQILVQPCYCYLLVLSRNLSWNLVRHDIITIISQRDEHCWVGELNGQRGWFPAKLVEVLDERSKQYSFAGDDSVSATVTDLVRGVLCPAIKQVEGEM